jgi:TonB family protein
MTERACYDGNGYINDMGKTLYKYDTNRNLTDEVCYNANGEQKSKTTHTYDANNKLTHSIALNYHPALFVSLNNLPYHTLYTYNERGYLTQIERYSEANSNRIRKTVRSYDQNGNLTEEIKYNNGTLETKTLYEYDNSGNRVKMTRYKSEILLIQELIEYKINYYDSTKYTSIEIEGFVEAPKKTTNNEKIKTDINFAEFEEDIHIAKVVIEEESIEDDQPFVRVEQMPSFMGGDLTTFRNWVMQQVRYPQIAQENNITGRVMLQFVIEKDGSLTNIKVIQTPDSSLSDEAIRVMKTSPKWTPGRQDDKPVRVMYTLPVEFRLQE